MQKGKIKIRAISIIIFIAILFLGAQISQAAPGPRGLAINTQTKECAGYWPGDEFVGYPLPEGWKAYYPTYSASDNSNWKKIQTEAGECSFQVQKEEACCMELGYTFVSRNIGKDQAKESKAKFPWNAFILLAVIIALLFFLFRYFLKKYRSKNNSNNK